MKILAISDSHGSYQQLKKQLPKDIDVLLLLGDIDYYELREIDKDFSCPKYGVLGNHDAFDYFDGTSILDLHGKIIECNHLKIAGFGGCPRYNRRLFGQFHEEDVRLFTKTLPKVNVFVAHGNPMRVMSYDEVDPHRGFMAFTEQMKDGKIDHFIHGHIHQDEEYRIGKATVHSVYPYKIIYI